MCQCKQTSFGVPRSWKFPELSLCVGTISGTDNQKENHQLRRLKETVYEGAKAKYNVEALKDNPAVRAYRDFYWRLDTDPTKTRLSGEALLRRVLDGNELPNISTTVDAYNLASMHLAARSRHGHITNAPLALEASLVARSVDDDPSKHRNVG